MKVYKVAHENIVCPNELKKVEIYSKSEVFSEFFTSVVYEEMINSIDLDNVPFHLDKDKYLNYLIKCWLEDTYIELMKNKFFDLGDYDLILVNE